MNKNDVLAVMDADAAHAEAYRIVYGVIDSTPREMRENSDEARAAVAELINTANRVWSKGGAVTGGEWDELGNAIARIGGAA